LFGANQSFDRAGGKLAPVRFTFIFLFYFGWEGVSMSGSTIKITLIANQGLLLESDGGKILIDALHEKNKGGFSPVSEENRRKLLNGESPFSDVSYLIFTHRHEDHYSASLLQEYLRHQNVKMLLLPDASVENDDALHSTIDALKINAYYFELPLFQKANLTLGDGIRLTYFNAVHAGGEAYKDIENYCILLELDQKKLLFLADADYDLAYFETQLGDTSIDALFVNLLYVNKAPGREIIQKLNPQHLIVYHIPFEKDDKMHFRFVAQSDAKKYADILPVMTLLQDEMQEMILE